MPPWKTFNEQKVTSQKRTSFKDLENEYYSVIRNMKQIDEMPISDSAKEAPIRELLQKIEEIKKRMHDYIDTL